MKTSKTPYTFTKKIGLIAAPIFFVVILFLPVNLFPSNEIQKVIAVSGWMLIWWITEAVSLSVTALLPIVLFPFTGINTVKEATLPYSSPIVFLFLGGFVIALSMEKWRLHLRIALNIIKLTGTNPKGILLGLMIATAFLSMWISNTATTVMMLPIALSIIKLLSDNENIPEHEFSNFSLCLMLGIAYAANVGGVATIIGTPPNSIFAGFVKESYNIEITFSKWISIGFPFSVSLLFITYLIISRVIYPFNFNSYQASNEYINQELKKLGKLNKGERKVLWVFVGTAFLWISRSYLTKLLPGLNISDTGIAIFAAVILFILPIDLKKGEFVLRWEDTEKLPWGILLLFGGGLSLANTMKNTGIIDLIGTSVTSSGNVNLFLITISLVAIMLFMTELMSNLALTTIFLPVVAGIALGLNADLLVMTIPVTIASSCAFMLPMSTPPNAIVFASGHVHVAQMAKAGILLNIIAIILLSLGIQTLLPWILSLNI